MFVRFLKPCLVDGTAFDADDVAHFADPAGQERIARELKRGTVVEVEPDAGTRAALTDPPDEADAPANGADATADQADATETTKPKSRRKQKTDPPNNDKQDG